MQQHSAGTSSSCALSSPEPGFPKRRAHAARLAVVPPEDAAEGGGLPQSYNASPTPLSGRTPRSRALGGFGGGGFSSSSKQQQPGGYSGAAGGSSDPAKQAVQVVLVLMLLVAAGSAAVLLRHRLAHATHQRQQFQAELALQVEWLAASMAEHRQCKLALERADAEYVTAQQSLALCRAAAQPSSAASHQPALLVSSAGSAAALPGGGGAPTDSNLPWLLHELEATRKALQATKLQLATTEGQLAALQASAQQGAAYKAATQALADSQAKLQAEQEAARQLTARLQRTEAELDDATQLLEEHDQEQLAAMAASASSVVGRRPQLHPAAADHGAAAAARTVILVACDAADARAGVMRPWGEAAVLASLPHVMVVTQHEGCEAAAAEAGLKVFKHDFKLPEALTGPGAAASAAAYRRYAALKQVLELGHPALSVEPNVLLLSSPLPLLQRYPTDVAVVSAAATRAEASNHNLAYGRLLPVPASGSRGPAAVFSTHPVSTALLHLRPSAASLQLVEGMMAGLAAGDSSEGALLNELLLTLWHLPAGSDAGGSAMMTSASSSSAAAMPDGRHTDAPLPLTVGVLPVERFVSSGALPGEADMQAWLQAHAPIAVRVDAGAAAGDEDEGEAGDHSRPDRLMEDILVHFWAGQPDHAVGHIEPPAAVAERDVVQHDDDDGDHNGGGSSSEPERRWRSRQHLEQQQERQHRRAPPDRLDDVASERRPEQQQEQEHEQRQHRARQQAEDHRSRRHPQQQWQSRRQPQARQAAREDEEGAGR